MKIVHIINFMGNGGVETFLKHLSLEQDKSHEVMIITLTNNNTYKTKDFSETNIKYVELPYSKFYDLRILFSLRNIIKNFNPDIVHIHLFPAQFIVPFYLFRINRHAKLITTEHGISYRRKKYKIFHFLEKLSFSFYKKIICVSDDVTNELKLEYPSYSNKIITINNGINIDKLRNTIGVSKSIISPKFSNDDILIAMVGRLEVGKDFETLIKSLKYLPDNFKLLIVGKGYKENDLKELVDKLNLADRVYFFGFKKDIYYIYKSIDLFVLSSEREGLPMVILEAMAAGNICLGSNVPGIKNLLNNSKLLFEYGNEIDLSNKILLALDNKDELQLFINNKINKYSFNDMFLNYEKEYSVGDD